MSKFSLLEVLNSESKETSDVTYQLYEINIGIEDINVYIPLDKTDLFEEKIDKLEDIDSYKLYKLSKSLGGYTIDAKNDG